MNPLKEPDSYGTTHRKMMYESLERPARPRNAPFVPLNRRKTDTVEHWLKWASFWAMVAFLVFAAVWLGRWVAVNG